MNQFKNAGHTLSLALKTDFTVDGKDEFEVGGKGKMGLAPNSAKDFWIASDDVEAGAFHKIPLWIFGRLY